MPQSKDTSKALINRASINWDNEVGEEVHVALLQRSVGPDRGYNELLWERLKNGKAMSIPNNCFMWTDRKSSYRVAVACLDSKRSFLSDEIDLSCTGYSEVAFWIGKGSDEELIVVRANFQGKGVSDHSKIVLKQVGIGEMGEAMAPDLTCTLRLINDTGYKIDLLAMLYQCGLFWLDTPPCLILHEGQEGPEKVGIEMMENGGVVIMDTRFRGDPEQPCSLKVIYSDQDGNGVKTPTGGVPLKLQREDQGGVLQVRLRADDLSNSDRIVIIYPNGRHEESFLLQPL